MKLKQLLFAAAAAAATNVRMLALLMHARVGGIQDQEQQLQLCYPSTSQTTHTHTHARVRARTYTHTHAHIHAQTHLTRSSTTSDSSKSSDTERLSKLLTACYRLSSALYTILRPPQIDKICAVLGLELKVYGLL